jgi:hypothetical protein
MARRSGTLTGSTKTFNGKLRCRGKLIMGKHGVYMVRGEGKLTSIQLVPWEMIVCPLPPARTAF